MLIWYLSKLLTCNMFIFCKFMIGMPCISKLLNYEELSYTNFLYKIINVSASLLKHFQDFQIYEHLVHLTSFFLYILFRKSKLDVGSDFYRKTIFLYHQRWDQVNCLVYWFFVIAIPSCANFMIKNCKKYAIIYSCYLHKYIWQP